MFTQRFPIVAALGLWVFAAGCASHTAPPPQTEKVTFRLPGSVPQVPQKPVDDWVPGVTNFAVISSDVWRGSQPTAQGFQLLASAGMKTVIDLREDDESQDIPAGVGYVWLPVSSWQADHVDVGRVLEAIAKSPKPVFIHCREGRDRTGLAVAGYRLSQGMSADDACQELRNFHVNTWWEGSIETRIHELSQRKLSGAAVASIVRDR